MVEKKQTVVLYPSPGAGHLISTIELGKLLLKHHPSLSITILITTPPYTTGSSTAPYITHLSQTSPLIHFHHLPTLSLPLDFSTSLYHEALVFEFLSLNNPLFQQAFESICQTSTVKALILDMFCSAAFELLHGQLDIPIYYFFPSGGSAHAFNLYLPTLAWQERSFSDVNSDAPLHIPGVPHALASDMPNTLLDSEDKSYQGWLHFTTLLPKSDGIIINTFDSMDDVAFKAIREGLCVPNSPTPPHYCIGPLIGEQVKHEGSSGKGIECLSWLDSQPSRSVVYLCFGSMGLFSEEQLKEIAIGLEKSGQRFLWVVRNPPIEDKTKKFLTPAEPDLSALLPQGFMDRTKDRGLVVKSWVPQLEVLNHESVGGFVTHCGWNSILEAISAGVPMVAWPLYAEQRINRVFLVKVKKLALPMEEREDWFVSASEVEKRVRDLIESDEGKAMREEAMKMSVAAKAALGEGGSSFKAIRELGNAWKLE